VTALIWFGTVILAALTFIGVGAAAVAAVEWVTGRRLG